MADQLLAIGFPGEVTRLKDMGDGTLSPTVYIGGSSAGGAGVAYTDASGTVGTLLATGVAANAARKILQIQNVSANILGFTVDGTAAVIGAAGTFTLAPGQGYSPRIPPTGQINVVGSAASTNYTLKWA